MLGKREQIDQHEIPGKGGAAHVGGIARTNFTQRQHLPKGLAGSGKPIYEAIGLLSKVPAAVWTGKRGGMQQNTAGTDRERIQLDFSFLSSVCLHATSFRNKLLLDAEC
jgi:hypothetical protein